MSEGGAPSNHSLDEILKLIAELREKLQDNPKLNDEQRAALEALLSFYLALTKTFKKQVDSLMSGL
jgi:hypothetical protein